VSIDPDSHCDAAYQAVADAFAGNFAELGELGAAVSIRVDGRPVVDLWGGHRDVARTQPWQRDTLVNAYSVGKGLLAVLTLRLVERGVLSLDRRVAELWPEFAAGGKGDVTLRTLLAHRVGLPAVRQPLAPAAMLHWDVMCRELAAQRPYWEPGRAHGYHVNTFGYLVGELIRRATRMDVGQALQEFVMQPVGEEFYYGLPSQHHARCAELQVPNVVLTDRAQWEVAFPPTGDEAHDQMIWHAYFNPAGTSGIGFVNTAPWRLAQIPSTNGHGTARAVSGVYQALLSGPPGAAAPWLGDEVLAEACTPHSDGRDRVLGKPSRFGLGFQLPQESRPIGPNPETFGHFGYGGTLGFADPVARVAFAFLTNRPGDRWQTPRTQRLVNALYSSLG
jgi:CubicO group peptidase (beta-lactamase class C family)